jgi:predicted N-formylglutamate amidohydrolase
VFGPRGSAKVAPVSALLSPGDPPPVVVENPGGQSPIVLIADHAGRAIPKSLGDLGVSGADMERHIAWDIGAAGLGRELARRLDATFIRQTYSRLVVDCNRDPARADAIPERSDGTIIAGNVGLSAEQREARVREIFQPYHDRIAEDLEARAAMGRRTLIVAVHSFTPVMTGKARPWRFGVLYLDAPPYSKAVLARLRAMVSVEEVGDNAPYAMDGVDFTIPHHAIARGLDYAEIETRQDLIGDEAGQAQVAALLAEVLATEL